MYFFVLSTQPISRCVAAVLSLLPPLCLFLSVRLSVCLSMSLCQSLYLSLPLPVSPSFIYLSHSSRPTASPVHDLYSPCLTPLLTLILHFSHLSSLTSPLKKRVTVSPTTQFFSSYYSHVDLLLN